MHVACAPQPNESRGTPTFGESIACSFSMLFAQDEPYCCTRFTLSHNYACVVGGGVIYPFITSNSFASV